MLGSVTVTLLCPLLAETTLLPLLHPAADTVTLFFALFRCVVILMLPIPVCPLLAVACTLMLVAVAAGDP